MHIYPTIISNTSSGKSVSFIVYNHVVMLLRFVFVDVSCEI